MVAQLLVYVVGIATGLLTNVIWEKRLRFSIWWAEKRQGGSHPFDYDPRDHGFYAVNRWSPARQLTPERLETIVVETRPKQTWFDEERWQEIADELAPKHSGRLCYLTDFEIDNHESEGSLSFRIHLARCGYHEHKATEQYLKEDAAARLALTEALDQGRARDVARSAPPSSISLKTVVVSPSGKFLAVKRSAAVDAAPGLWSLGPEEAMKVPDYIEPGRGEDLFALAERGLKEELGLDPEHYGQINISWLGYYVPLAKIAVVAQVKTRISERAVTERLNSSHSVFETETHAWLPLKRDQLMDIIENPSGDAEGRRWTDGSPLAAQELWRMRRLLGING